MNPKLWIALCSSLLLYNVAILWRDSYSINYVILEEEDRLYDNATNYLICVQWDNIRAMNKERFDSLLTNVSVEGFVDYCILSIETKLNASDMFNKNQTFVFNKSFCFLVSKEELEKDFPLNGLLKYYHTRFYIFSNGKLPIFYEYYYKWDEFGGYNYFLKTIKQKVYGQNFLRNPGCFTFKGQLASNRAYCLNECFKKQSIKLNFYTLADRDTRFDLLAINMEGQNKTKKNYYNQFDILSRIEMFLRRDEYGWQGEQYDIYNSTCFKECPEDTDCFIEAFDMVMLNRSHYERFRKKHGKPKIELTQVLYRGHYSMEDYSLQLFGLFTLFSGTSVLAALVRLSDALTKRIHTTNKYLKFVISKNKFVLVLVTSAYILIQSAVMLTDYRFRSNYPNKTSILNFTSDPFSLVVCFPVEILMHDDEQIVNGRNSAILEQRTLAQLQNSTGSGRRLLKRFEILYGLRTVDFDFEFLTTSILFKNASFERQPCLARCFRIEFSVLEPKYRVMIPLLYLSIEFKTKFWELYVIDRNQSFTSNLNAFTGSFLVRKNTVLSSRRSRKSNCANYAESSVARSMACSSKQSCYDRCVNRLFFEKHGSISTHSVIDQLNVFDPSAHFNQSKDEEIEAKCGRRFSRTDCVAVFFEESLELVENPNQNYSIFMKLNYEYQVEKELEQSLLKVIIDIVNLKSIILGLNASGLLFGLFPILKRLFKYRDTKFFCRFNEFPLSRLFSYRLLVLVLCFLGFSTHNIFLFNGIIRSDLIESGSFRKLSTYNLPNLIFCLAINQSKVDENHELTAGYLNTITAELNLRTIFRKFSLENKTHDRIAFTKQMNLSDDLLFFEDHDIRLTHFYHSNLKCFKIRVKTTFLEEDFHFYITSKVFRVQFRDWFLKTFDSVLFMYQERESLQIDGGFLVRIGFVNYPLTKMFYYNKVEFQYFEISRQDNFELLREPRSLFYERSSPNDQTKAMSRMKDQFKARFGLTSRENLLDLNDSACPIDESLYRQYFLQVANKSNQPSSLNFRQRRFNILNQISHRYNPSYDFSFSISLISRQTEIVNEDNYGKLLISVLNTLSLWFNICVLNLIVGIHKFVEFNLIVYKLLTGTRDHLTAELKRSL